MGIFHDEEFFEEPLFDGGVVEVPNSVLLSSLDAQTIAETYGVLVEDVMAARQELFAQAGAAQPAPSGHWFRQRGGREVRAGDRLVVRGAAVSSFVRDVGFLAGVRIRSRGRKGRHEECFKRGRNVGEPGSSALRRRHCSR